MQKLLQPGLGIPLLASPIPKLKVSGNRYRRRHLHPPRIPCLPRPLGRSKRAHKPPGHIRNELSYKNLPPSSPLSQAVSLHTAVHGVVHKARRGSVHTYTLAGRRAMHTVGKGERVVDCKYRTDQGYTEAVYGRVLWFF